MPSDGKSSHGLWPGEPIWFRGFRGEDLNVKTYDVRWKPSDGKSSPGLWPGELKIP